MNWKRVFLFGIGAFFVGNLISFVVGFVSAMSESEPRAWLEILQMFDNPFGQFLVYARLASVQSERVLEHVLAACTVVVLITLAIVVPLGQLTLPGDLLDIGIGYAAALLGWGLGAKLLSDSAKKTSP